MTQVALCVGNTVTANQTKAINPAGLTFDTHCVSTTSRTTAHLNVSLSSCLQRSGSPQHSTVVYTSSLHASRS